MHHGCGGCPSCIPPGTELALRVVVRGDGELAIVERSLQGDALAAVLGAMPDPLVKAADPRHHTWRYTDLDVLIARARRDFARYGQSLTDLLVEMHANGKLYPLTSKREATLRRIFESHEAWFVARFTGLDHLVEQVHVAHRNGWLPKRLDIDGPASLEVAVRMGRGLDMLNASLHYATHAPPGAGGEAQVRALVEHAMTVPLSRSEEHALRYMQRKAASKMRAPAHQYQGNVERILASHERPLTDDEYAAIRGRGEMAVAQRLTTPELARQLGEEHTQRITNNMDRVARTETQDAHSMGGYLALRAAAAEAGIVDPEVYKITSPRACVHCRRIWGTGGSIRYPLSVVEERERAGGNVGLPARDWGPTITTTHPNCTCGSLLLYIREAHEDMIAAADEIIAGWKAEQEAAHG